MGNTLLVTLAARSVITAVRVNGKMQVAAKLLCPLSHWAVPAYPEPLGGRSQGPVLRTCSFLKIRAAVACIKVCGEWSAPVFLFFDHLNSFWTIGRAN